MAALPGAESVHRWSTDAHLVEHCSSAEDKYMMGGRRGRGRCHCKATGRLCRVTTTGLCPPLHTVDTTVMEPRGEGEGRLVSKHQINS